MHSVQLRRLWPSGSDRNEGVYGCGLGDEGELKAFQAFTNGTAWSAADERLLTLWFGLGPVDRGCG